MTKPGKFTARAIAFFALLLTTASFCYAQTDTVYINNEKVPCLVKEVTPDMVKFVLPGEQVLNSVYRATVQKVVFGNGRVQVFAEFSANKPVTSVIDYDMVAIAAADDDIENLHNVADLATKETGVPAYSNAESVKDRAYQKLKAQAAMYGANMISITSSHANGSDLVESASPSLELTGVAYASSLPDYQQFSKLIAGKSDLYTTTIYKLSQDNGGLSHNEDNKYFKIKSSSIKNGIVKIEADLDGEKRVHTFQLAGVDATGFNVAYTYNRTVYNLRITWQQ